MPLTSSVPVIEFTEAGPVIPDESAILAGVQSDMNAAFGGGLNPALETPQGQLASSQTAIIADKNSDFAYYVNQVDPQYASGRFQDGIARIYFLNRKSATPTVVIATLSGLPGTVIPVGTLAQDTSGNIYSCTGNATIGLASTVDAEFQNIVTGPIACAAGTLTNVYQAIPGWDTITNAEDGILGVNVETRQEFEYRRKNSVSVNANGTPGAIYGAVFNVDNVLDVYVIDNPESYSVFDASISGTTLTITTRVSGQVKLGSVIVGIGVTANTYITALGTGTGGAGTYTVNHSQSVSSEMMYSASCVVGASHYELVANSIYVAVVGGLDADVAQAIFTKKDVGCNYNGNTTVTVTDESGYSYPQPSYTVTFERPIALPILFAVDIIDNSMLPSNIVDLVKDAIIARFNGTDGTSRERIGANVYASRYYAAVSTVNSNVAIDSILIGTSSATLTSIPIGIDQQPTITSADIVVSLI